MSVARLQKDFQDYLLHGVTAVQHACLDGPRLDAPSRLSIYASAYTLRLIEILRTDYPALAQLAGPEQFEQSARAYIDAHPSQSPNARWFGEHLSTFLRGEAGIAGLPALAEMAQFEWALNTAFDAPDAAVIELTELAAVPASAWPGLAFSFHPSLQRLDLNWGVPAFWTAVQQGGSTAEPPAPSARQPWLVWRRDLTTCFRSLESDEAWMLDAALDGIRFAQLCDGLASRIAADDDVAVRAIGLLKRWIDEGLFIAIERA